MDLLPLLNYGVAVFCLVSLGMGVWIVLRWTANYVILPIVNRWLKFLDDLTLAIVTQSHALQTMAVQQGNMAIQQGENLRTLADLVEKVEQLVDKVTDIHQRFGSMEIHADSVVLHDNGKGPHA